MQLRSSLNYEQLTNSVCLICVASAHKLHAGQDNDLEVLSQAPVVNVPEVAVDPALHLFNASRFAPKAFDLGPAGYSRFYMMAERIIRQQVAEMIVMRQCMRPRPHQRHIPTENIEQLGQFIDAGITQNSTDWRDTRVNSLGLLQIVTVFHHRHRSEFEYHERL